MIHNTRQSTQMQSTHSYNMIIYVYRQSILITILHKHMHNNNTTHINQQCTIIKHKHISNRQHRKIRILINCKQTHQAYPKPTSSRQTWKPRYANTHHKHKTQQSQYNLIMRNNSNLLYISMYTHITSNNPTS